jgi:hypothetical protein
MQKTRKVMWGCKDSVTKRERPTITDDACTVYRRPRRLMFYGSISYPLSSEALKFDLPAFSAYDTKREGIHKFYGSYTTYRGPCQPTFCWSIPHQTPIPPQIQTVFLVPSLICCDQTQQHNTQRNMHIIQVHQRKMLSSYSQVIYMLRKHMHVLQHKTTSPCSFSCSLFFCSMNSATYQTQGKSKT